MKPKLIRLTTVPGSLGGLLRGQLKFMTNHFEVIGISSSGNDVRSLAEIGEQESVRVIPVEMTRKITLLKDLLAVWKLYKIFKNEKPTIVHTHTPKAGTVGMIAAYFAKVPYRLHTVAGLPLLEVTGMKRNLLNTVEKITYRFATEIYPNSFGLKEVIIQQKYTKEDKLKVIAQGSSNGIDTDHFNPTLYDEVNKTELRNRLNIKPTDYVFIFVGRIVSDKGINELINTFRELVVKFPKIKLLLVGAYEKDLDPIQKENENYIEQSESIITTGWQNDVRPFFSISNSLVFPSYREGFPNVVMQACSMGIPSIVTNINGCNELIKHGENGLIIPTKDSEKLKLAMIEIMNKNISQVSNEIRQFMIDNYSRKFIHNEILKNYTSLLKRDKV
ncbi:glycosyltransferase family 4 protein [Flagellimonas sp. CMM7]|uniref:glycosyltransferase family 4 protein n=1 Tax=Flagellimonas sp. CMM7 TaxID=2654676 RepID=UPI0013D60779|nr:glycosyltransferase family 4 protein [Flagellimonas sp. CMM7]UII79921.1 glycosyltransferase family 4 protein [Flagellimonas sp. CMM7]